MRTSRVTVLMRPDEKASLEQRASKLGMSSGEFIRLAVDNLEQLRPEEEAELAMLAGEMRDAAPRMGASLDRSIAALEEAHREIDALLRRQGIRK